MTAEHSGLALADPLRDCPLCPRLVEFRHESQEKYPHFYNGPVPSWGPDAADGGAKSVKLLVVGLAPGMKGANATGRPFTGDWAGDLLYATLDKFDFTEGTFAAHPGDGLKLKGCAITNAVRCVPPQNKPVGAEINTCRQFLTQTLDELPNLKVMVTLGKIAHDSLSRTLGERVAAHPFGHNRETAMGGYAVVSSYHCSRYNTNTGRLTPQMFEDVFARARALADG
ncbi:uracil-DNA glycosylase [Ahrensia sp. R2A130]|uniref:uracil-DNA glycosylase n=1 Tax=Ahrensia sp. R2A130 TaxID=744979 RepID=UPI0001E0A44B|nr:uracil-DNA glycosylase [Ahrensia sp. R2A130]EFL90659.1 uracil-DNA glycosylase family protein [Ahrensia sp. R2A130]